MQTAIFLLWVMFPVLQEDQQAEPIRSTSDTPTFQQDSVPPLTAPFEIELPGNDLADVTSVQLRSLNGSWQLSWNDDLTDDTFSKSCDMKLKDVDNILSGSFIGPVAGRERDAIITGRIEGTGQSRILTFQQRENGYICSYQAVYSSGGITGVWHDTENRSGKFQLLKYQ